MYMLQLSLSSKIALLQHSQLSIGRCYSVCGLKATRLDVWNACRKDATPNISVRTTKTGRVYVIFIYNSLFNAVCIFKHSFFKNRLKTVVLIKWLLEVSLQIVIFVFPNSVYMFCIRYYINAIFPAQKFCNIKFSRTLIKLLISH